MTIRRKLAKKYLWREARIRKMTENILSKYAEVSDVTTKKLPEYVKPNISTKQTHETSIILKPFFCTDYLKAKCTKEMWVERGTGINFYWGNPGVMDTRLICEFRYPHPLDGGSGKNPPIVREIEDRMRITNFTNLGYSVYEDCSHISFVDHARFALPPRFVLRDIRRAYKVLIDEAKEREWY